MSVNRSRVACLAPRDTLPATQSRGVPTSPSFSSSCTSASVIVSSDVRGVGGVTIGLPAIASHANDGSLVTNEGVAARLLLASLMSSSSIIPDIPCGNDVS